MAKRPTAPIPRRLTVRMYRDILGDCFLIRAPKGDGTVAVLIDCGILQGTPAAAERAARIMTDVARETANHLDVLIVTHEHWDHVSGFGQAADVFAEITVGELWLAWTEDPRDEMARHLGESRRRALAVVCRCHAAAVAMASRSSDGDAEPEEEPPRNHGLSELLAFYGIDAGSGTAALGPSLAAAARATTATILDGLRAKAKSVRYFRPGVDPVPVAGLDDLRAFVLGPPRDESLLKRSDPRKGTGEVYQLTGDGTDELFHLAALARSEDGPTSAEVDLALPFGKRLLLPTEPDPSPTSRTREEIEARAAHREVYLRPEDEWRRIEQDWLMAGEQLALKLDNDTNNTSLALAFEIGRGRDARVMLFPGDAQVGNWLSWGDLKWTVTDADDRRREVGIEDLLARTVLYKVGHHGSDNATLRERGLELMTHRDLVAMLPVEETVARDPARRWNMPFPSLLARLEEKTGRRIVRADRGVAELVEVARTRAGAPAELSREEWDRFLAALREISDATGPLAIEYALEM